MPVTLINPFEVAAGQEAAFVENWKRTAAVFSGKPGYLDTRLHRSLDPAARFRFVNVAHWESAEAWAEAIKAFPPKEGGLAGIKANPALYEPMPGGSIGARHASTGEDDAFTQVVRFEVEPDKQGALIAAIAAEVERWVCRRPGFVSATLHASLDGRHVLNYARWRTEADFAAFTDDPESERLGAAVCAAGPSRGPEATPYRVVRSIGAPGGRNG